MSLEVVKLTMSGGLEFAALLYVVSGCPPVPAQRASSDCLDSLNGGGIDCVCITI